MISWDESKRRANLRKHGIDFAQIETVFDLPMITVEDERDNYGEVRLQSLGLWNNRVVFLAWTPRDDDTAHLISCRYANRKETQSYSAIL